MLLFLPFLSLFHTLAAAKNQLSIRQELAAVIARTQADNLAHPRNTSELAIGPQIYEAPLICSLANLIFPGMYEVTLARHHSITEHQAFIGHDLRPFIKFVHTFNKAYDEKAYTATRVDEQLLVAIRSDPKVLLVMCDYPRIE
jgi:hypothetical protein